MQEIRLSPSGPVIATIGSGFMTRNEELSSPIAGTLQIPATLAEGVVCLDGFGGATPLEVSMNTPDPAKKYSGEVWVDTSNGSSNVEGVIVMELQASVDGGTTWVGVARNQHLAASEGGAGADAETRMMRLNLVPTLGSALGIVAASPSLKFRVRIGAQAGTVSIYSPTTDAYGNGGLKGCFFMRMSEMLAA